VTAQHRDSAVAEVSEVLEGARGAVGIVRVDAQLVLALGGAVGQHHGQVGPRPGREDAEAHGGVDEGVDLAAFELVDGGGFALVAGVEVHHEHDVAGGLGALGRGGEQPAAEGGGCDRVRDHADGVGGLAPQGPRDVVRFVAQPLGRVQDALLGLRGDVAGLAGVERERDRCGGNARRLCHVGGAHATTCVAGHAVMGAGGGGGVKRGGLARGWLTMPQVDPQPARCSSLHRLAGGNRRRRSAPRV